jgi:hypothetical protein
MNLNLNDEQVRELKQKFDAWMEIQERRKELSEENKAVCADAARIIEGKNSDAGKLFKNMKLLYDGEDAEANNISILLERIGNV